MAFFVPLALLCTLPSSVLYPYAFALSAINLVITFPPSSSLKRPITFLFLPMGNGLLSFLSYADLPNYFSTSPTISL